MFIQKQWAKFPEAIAKEGTHPLLDVIFVLRKASGCRWDFQGRPRVWNLWFNMCANMIDMSHKEICSSQPNSQPGFQIRMPFVFAAPIRQKALKNYWKDYTIDHYMVVHQLRDNCFPTSGFSCSTTSCFSAASATGYPCRGGSGERQVVNSPKNVIFRD